MAAEPPPGVPPLPSFEPATFTLRDGSPVLVRPILPEDGDRLREGFARLSDESRYRRFMSPLPALSDEQVRYLTEIDYRDHMAWVALDPASPGHPGLGVARYVRLPSEPTVAEAAVTVIDAYQGRGLGTLLLGLLALSARQNGIGAFRAYVLSENAPMLEILVQLGAEVTREDGTELRVDVPIPEDPDDLPDTPTGRVFKAVAKRMIPPFSLVTPHMP